MPLCLQSSISSSYSSIFFQLPCPWFMSIFLLVLSQANKLISFFLFFIQRCAKIKDNDFQKVVRILASLLYAIDTKSVRFWYSGVPAFIFSFPRAQQLLFAVVLICKMILKWRPPLYKASLLTLDIPKVCRTKSFFPCLGAMWSCYCFIHSFDDVFYFFFS